VISQPTDGILPCRRRPIPFIITEQRRKKNGEKPLRFHDFTILSLTFFLIELLFWGNRVICDISAHRLIFAPPPLSTNCVDIKRVATQKEWREIIAFSRFYSSSTHLFFNEIDLFWGEHVICDISAHRVIFPRQCHRPITFI
jgi:hypothetical protein